ncbi:allantoicase [Jimgerdemannia flammicorona]|uniref:Allantoicase n=1 Tax=Jimgerdemannia flammicorona TaxID=994334 RepID=A0A433QBL4_9FUNG|nr:allantoicase [Jimgerdemannia flammicorona]
MPNEIIMDRRRNGDHFERENGVKKVKIDHIDTNGHTNGHTNGRHVSVVLPTPTTYQRIGQDDFRNSILGTCVDLANAASGGQIVSFTDEFFAQATNMIQPTPAMHCPGRFTENGAWMDGWETRRHNPTYDWCVVKLGFAGVIRGFDLDTSYFTGNQAPVASVEACRCDEGDPSNDAEWEDILPKIELAPNAHHIFVLADINEEIFTHVRLNIYPDGGIARFRIYGQVRPIWPKDPTEVIDLAFVGNGGRAVEVSDQHYGQGSNLLLPGRGINMGDGWETKRSRVLNHKDWVTIRLGDKGRLREAEIDTAHFKGNFPDYVLLEACLCYEDLPSENTEWVTILDRSKVGPHKQHRFELQSQDRLFSHVRITIFPDGGVKRLRIFGTRGIPGAPTSAQPTSAPLTRIHSSLQVISAVALTAADYAPYGQVIESTPPTATTTRANQGTAQKLSNVAQVVNLRLPGSEAESKGRQLAVPNMCIFRCEPAREIPVKFRILERHLYSTQAFVPMGGEGGRAYLVAVALNGSDDMPDMTTFRVFLASQCQGISYNPGVWHHPMIALEETTNFLCLVHESGVAEDDCHEVPFPRDALGREMAVTLPGFRASA